MTRYIDIDDIGQLIRKVGISTFIAELAGYIRADFEHWHQFERSPRLAHHSKNGVIELMPISDKSLFGFKYVNGHPKNQRYHLPTVMAFGTLADVETGYPQLLSELTITTALRTAATSALAAQVMASPGSRTMAMIGCGAQAEFQILAFHALVGINEVRAYDIDPAATRKLMRNLSGVSGLRITATTSTQDAATGADIITTATADKTNATILTPDMIAPGMHINAIGGDCPGKTELDPEILRHARVMVEFEPQTRVEGEIQQMPPAFPVVEIWQVLTGAAMGRESPEQITVFDSVGFALEDFSSLRYINDLASEHAIGKQIALVPTQGNPKDLYQLINAKDKP